MTRFEYLKQIEKELKRKIPDNELYDIMRDYAEFFEEGKKQNKTEAEIIDGLGSPDDIAADILETPKDATARKSDFTDKLAKGTKKATHTVINVAETTISNISEAVKETSTKAKERAEIKKQTNSTNNVNVTVKPNQTNLFPIIGIILGFAVYPALVGLALSGLGGVAGFIALIVLISTVSIFSNAIYVLLMVLISLAVLAFSFGVILLSIYLFNMYNEHFFNIKFSKKGEVKND